MLRGHGYFSKTPEIIYLFQLEFMPTYRCRVGEILRSFWRKLYTIYAKSPQYCIQFSRICIYLGWRPPRFKIYLGWVSYRRTHRHF